MTQEKETVGVKYSIEKKIEVKTTELRTDEENEIATTFYYFLGLRDRIKFPIGYKQLFRKSIDELKGDK